MHRLGLIDFWYYVNQEFHFKDGHMLLRGSNGSGKSVTLQSFIPLLLDGNKSSERLDPFGTRSRKLENYLIDENDTRDDRIGYLYLEFKREGIEIYKTIGMGLHARRNKPLQTWYFVIEDNQRINYDLKLMEHDLAITKNTLKNRIGTQLIDYQKEYMAKVNEALFGFPTTDEYKEAVDLLLQVRSPKLSNSLKPTMLNEILSDSLQPLSEEDLRPMSEAIQSMDETKEQLSALKESYESAKIISNVYHDYNVSLLSHKLNRVFNEKQKKNTLMKDIKETNKQVKHIQKEIDEDQIHKQDIENEKIILQNEQASYAQQDLIVLAQEVNRLKESNADKKAQMDKKENIRKNKSENLNIQIQKNKDRNNECEQYLYNLNKTYKEMNEIQNNIDFEEHEILKEEVLKQPENDYDYAYTKDRIKKEIQLLDDGITEFNKINQIKQSLNQQLNLKENYLSQKEKKTNELNENEKLLNEQIEEYIQKFFKWNEQNQLLKLNDKKMKDIMEILQRFLVEDNYSTIEEFIRTDYFNIYEDIVNKKNKLENQLEVLKKEKTEIEKQYHKWENMKDPVPETDIYEEENQKYLKENNVIYYPFYTLLEFDENLDSTTRNRIEEMFVRLHLLNAYVVHEKDKDKVLIHKDGTAGTYLFTSLNLEEIKPYYIKDMNMHSIFDYFKIDNQIEMNENWYKNDMLYGTVSNMETSKFIGKLSREKYRIQKLNEYQEQLNEINQIVTDINEQINSCNEKLDILKEEFHTYPLKDNLELAKNMVLQSEKDLEDIELRLNGVQKQIDKYEEDIINIKVKISEIAKHLGISVLEEIFKERKDYFKEYNDLLSDFSEIHHVYLNKYEMVRMSNETIQQLENDLDELLHELHLLSNEIDRNSKNIELKEKQLEEMGFDEIKDRLTYIEQRLSEIDDDNESLVEKIATNRNQLTVLNDKLNKLNEDEITQNEVYETAYTSYLQECELGYVLPIEFEYKDCDDTLIYLNSMNSVRKNKDELHDELQKVFYSQRGNLQEYNLSNVSIFNEDEYSRRLDIMAKYKGSKITFNKLVECLDNAVEEQKLLLVENERQLIEDVLVNTISRKIRLHINNSKRWVDNMNRYMNAMNTSSTLKLNLKWMSHKAENEDELSSEKLVELLTKDVKLLKESDRNKLSSHFRSKIATATKLAQQEDTKESFHTIMKRVMDYRAWFDFKILYEKAGEKKKEMTNTSFFQSSGGEKAMSMYIPLFSAVAAKFESAREDAPVLIALDEAFAGVDEKNIINMFDLIHKFKFDYIMNSQVLWGDYPTVKSLMIHELFRPENAKYVTVITYEWNGNRKVLVNL